jgi:fibronectin-binding autotransporter adhesin
MSLRFLLRRVTFTSQSMTNQVAAASCICAAILLIGFIDPDIVTAASFTQSTGGTWNSGGNWNGGIPNSVGAIANFDALDVPDNTNATVTLDGSFTVGSLLLGDIVPATVSTNMFPALASNWIINPGTPSSSTLTLATSSGTPTINVVNPTAQPLNSTGPPAAQQGYKLFVPQAAFINVPLGGNQGMAKTGLGALVLAAANTYSGTTSVLNGVGTPQTNSNTNDGLNNGGLTLDFSGALSPTAPPTAPPISNIIPAGNSLVLGGGLAVAGNGVLNVVGKSGATNSQTFNGTALDFGDNSINVLQSGATAVNLSLGTVTRLNHGVVNFTLPTTGTVLANIANTNGIIGGWATVGVGANATWAINDGSGHIVGMTSGFTDYTGAPTINADPTANVRWSGGTGNAALNPGTTDINSLIFTDVYTTTANLRVINQPSGSTLRMGASGGIFRTDNIGNQAQLLITIGNSNTSYLTAGGAPNTAGELNFNANNAPLNADQNGIVVASVITNNGTGVVTVSSGGVSTTQINVAASYSGGTYINSGRYRAQAQGSMGTGPVYTAPGAQAYFNAGGNADYYNNLYLSGMGYSETGGFTSANVRVAGAAAVLAGTVTLMGDSMFSSRGNTGTPGAFITGQITGGFSPYFSGGQTGGTTPGTWNLTNAGNNYTGDTVLLNGRVTIGGTGEVIPDGPGKGNLVMIGEGYLNGGTSSAGVQAHLNLNGNTETVNGLISNQGFEGHTSDPTFIVIDNSLSNSVGTLNVGGNNASSNFAGLIRDQNTASEGLPAPTNAFVAIGKIGSGTLTLSGTNTYSGGTKIMGGTVQLGNVSGIGTGNVTMSGGTTLDLNGNGNGTPLTVRSLSGTGGTVTSSTAGPGPLTLVVGDSNNVSSSFGGVIQNGAATVGLQKEGTGQLTLSGANAYTGATVINNGGLVVTGSLASTGTVTLAASGNPTVLAGTGSVGNVVLASASNGTVRPGSSSTDHSIGTLATTGLTVNNGAFQFDLSGPGGDKVTVSGTANFVGGGSSTIGVTFIGAPIAGSYPLISATTLTLGHTPTLDTNTSSLFASSRFTSASLTTGGNTISFNLVGSNANLTWTGGQDGSSWDLNTNQNWSTNGGTTTNAKFFTFDNVTFDDNAAGSANHTINLLAPVTPASVTVNHSTGADYLIQGGGIGGDGTSLTKLGTGLLILSPTNDTYGGGTFVKNGTLRIGSLTSLPAGSSVTLGDDATNSSGVLDLNGQQVTIGSLTTAGTGTGNIVGSGSGSATLTFSGGASTFSGKIQNTVPGSSPGPTVALIVMSGTLTLSGNNNFTGGTTIGAGATLKLGSGNSLSSTGALTLAFGGTLDLNGNNATVGMLNNDPNNASAAGAILSSVAGAAKITIGDPISDSTFAGRIQDGSGTVSVTKTNNTTLTLSGVNNYSGTTELAAGTLKVGSFLSLGSATGGPVVIDSGATLDLTGASATGLAAAANIPGQNLQQKTIQVSGSGVGGNGAIINTGNAQENVFGHILLLGDATFGGSATSTSSTTTNGRYDIHDALVGSSTTTNGGSLDLNSHTLTKIGSNVFGIVCADVTAGDIVVGVGGAPPVPGGTLSIEGTANVAAATIPSGPLAGQPSTITINDGSEIQFSGNTGTITRPIILNGNTIVGAAGNPLLGNNAAAGLQAVVTSPITLNGTATFEATNGFSGSVNAAGTSVLILNGSIGQAGGPQSIVKATASTLVLGGVNTYTGDTAVNGGILRLGTANAINVGSRLNLGGGTFDSGGFNETMGPLLLSSSSTIDLSNGASALHFADSAAQSWSGTLTVNNWTPGTDHLFVGSTATLTAPQLTDFTFANHPAGARQSTSGEVFPLPILTLGDFDQDGHVNVSDISAGEVAVTDVNGFTSKFDLIGNELLQIADVNNIDSKFTNNDLQGLITLIANTNNGAGTASAVPEPASLALWSAGIIAVIFLGRRREKRNRF